MPHPGPALAALSSLLVLSAAKPQEAPPSHQRLRKAWSLLLPEEQQEVTARFSAEARELQTLQGQLIEHVLGRSQVDPGLHALDGPTPFFDPARHAPAQPIPRTRLAADDPQALAVLRRTFHDLPEPPFHSAWRYDWGRREVLRSGEPFSPEHVFALALAGYAPLADLAVALVEQALDRGEEQLALSAFSHAYTDREGLVYPGVTLYDTWCSGLEIEMPDVDVLGLLHSITGERGQWVAPIPAAQHDELYAKIRRLFQEAYRYRALRSALALCYLSGSPPLRDGYAAHLPRMHGLWDETGSQPAVLAPLLPRSSDLADFFESWGLRFESDAERVDRARARAKTLEDDAQRTRALLATILQESGALERKSRPRPATQPPAKQSRARGGQ